MLQRKRTGSILCPSCGKLVGVADEQCYYCGRKNPGMWGLTSVLGGIGRQWPFESIVTGGCAFLYLAMLAVMAVNTPEQIRFMPGGFQILPPSGEALVRFGASGAIPVFELGRWWTVLSAGWLHAKLVLVLVLSGVHGFFARWVKDFAADRNSNSQKFYRLINEIPTLLMIGIVILVVIKPF